MNFNGFFPKFEKNEPWQIIASRFCVESSEEGFTLEELKDFIHHKYNVRDVHIQQFFLEEIQHPSGRQYPRTADTAHPEWRWIAPLELVSKITDYEELKEARKNSKNAFWLSISSILIALASFIATVY